MISNTAFDGFDYFQPEIWSRTNNEHVVMSKITVNSSVIFFKVFSNYIFESDSNMIYDLISFKEHGHKTN